MASVEPDSAAFPCKEETVEWGLTKFEYIATQIAAASCSDGDRAFSKRAMAEFACDMAAALIDEMHRRSS